MTHRRQAWLPGMILAAVVSLIITGCGLTGLTSAGPGHGGGPPPDDADAIAQQLRTAADGIVWPARALSADAVQHPVVLDENRRAAATIGPDGGEIEVIASEGVRLRLIVPAEAVFFPTEIAITPIQTVGGLDGALIGVDIAPHGLQLAELARLEITGAPPGPVIGFGYSGSGADLALAVVDPDPGQLVVYVDHFSGLGVGPFAALSEALSASTDAARAELATAAATAHNGGAETAADRLSRAYAGLVDALAGLAATTPEACGRSDFADRFAVQAWLGLNERFAADFDLDITRLDVIHALTEHLLTCWKNETYSCARPSPAQLRALQGIRAALIRFKALDTAREQSGKDSLSQLLPCGAGGFVDYRYDSDASGVSTQISVHLDLRMVKDPDGDGLMGGTDSSYAITYASSKGGDCPASEYGQTSLSLSETVSGEIVPELQVSLEGDVPSIWFTPVYYGHWADCHDAGSGWQTLALACDPDDPSGGDSMTGAWGPGRRMFYVVCENQDHTATTTGVVFLDGALDWLIPRELWD